MVAVIRSGRSLRAILNYNEEKVEEKVAICLEAANYPLDAHDLTYNQKLMRLQKLADVNTRTKVNAVHISLNFDPSEMISSEKMQEIATDYMDRIGFGQQPFLVYRHMDAGHPHCHIVTTTIQPNGKPIPLHKLGEIQSEKARKELEIQYGLVKAEGHAEIIADLKPINVARAIYGKTQTKRAIYNVLNAVLRPYKYTSLAELNAVLRLYNVAAERGSEDSRTHKHNGLLYRVLDSEGKPVGVPIKASLFPAVFPQKPTLKFIESRYAVNDALRQNDKKRIKSAVDFALHHGARTTIEAMIKELSSKGIATVLRQNAQGLIYGITFIDHQTKAVFKGSDLGKQYSASGIAERCGGTKVAELDDQKITHKGNEQTLTDGSRSQISIPKQQLSIEKIDREKELLNDLFRVEQGVGYLPGQWKKRRKRKKRNQSNNL